MTDIALAILVDRFVRRMHLSLQATASDIDPENVGPGGGMIQLMLADLEPIGIAELTKEMSRDKSQMTRMVRSMEQKKLIERVESTDDARVSLVSLTPRGQKVVEGLRVGVANTLNTVLSPINDADRTELKDILTRALT